MRSPTCSGRDFSRAAISAEIRYGFPWHTPEVPHPLLADPDAWWMQLGRILTDAIGRLGVGAAAATVSADRVRLHYTDPASWKLVPDAVPTLATLSTLGWRHVLLSNHVPELPGIVNAMGLGPHLVAIVNSAATGYEKPHPEAFRPALEQADRPATAWMIGDNPVADVAGAVSAGLQAILVRTRPADGSHHVPDLAGVIDLVND